MTLTKISTTLYTVIKKFVKDVAALNLEDLKYLLEIERSGSINKAAQNLFIARSSLMYSLQTTEKELGYQIFERSKQGVHPTVEGLAVLEDAKQVLEIISKWYKKTDEQNYPSDTISIMLVPVAAQILGHELLVNLRESYPNLEITFDERRIAHDDAEKFFSILNDSSSRIYIGTMAASERQEFKKSIGEDINWEYYWEDIDEMVLYASADLVPDNNRSLSLDDVRDFPLLYYPDSNLQKFGYSELLDHFPQKQKYKMSTSNFMLELVSKGTAVVLASWLATKDFAAVRSGKIKPVRIKDYPMAMTYFILYPSPLKISRTESFVVNVLQQYFRRLAKQL